MSLYRELKRRNVFRVAIAYLAGAWLLTEVAGTLFPAFGVPEWGFRFVVILFALGFVPALIISWAYELTPEGVKREKDVVRDESIAHITAKRLDGITIGLIVLALAFILADRFWLGQRFSKPAEAPATVALGPRPKAESPAADSVYPPNTIAVLPFVNMSEDAGNEYFSDGIAEELLNLLAGIPELRVIARTSSFSYKGKDVKIADIAHDLKVRHVLEGSVRKAGNRVRITAQLIETASGTHLWSETYDRTLDDIFAIQDEIAGEVVDSMKVVLLGVASPKTKETDPEAYALYLQCRHFSAGNQEELRRGEQYCRQSLEIDPNYAPAWASLGTIYTTLAISGYIDFRDGYAKKLEFTRRALELDPNLAYAHGGLAWHAMMYERDLQAAAEHYRIALKLSPNDSRILAGAAVLAEGLGRFDRAIELAEQALTVNPLGWVIYGNTAIVRCWAGQFELANAWFDKALELKPSDIGDPWRAKCYLLQGQPEKALTEANRIDLEARRLWILPMAFYELGQFGASDQALEVLIEDHAHEAASFIAENFAWRGELDQAFEWLDRAKREKQYMWGSLVFDPAFSDLHADPRWADFRARDGRSAEQIREIVF
jgi:adenylate cyclase